LQLLSEVTAHDAQDAAHDAQDTAPADASAQDCVMQGGTESIERCRPLNLTDYRNRLETFCGPWWFNMPLGISPIQCARRGWVNIGQDTLECRCCSEQLVVTSRGDGFSVSATTAATGGTDAAAGGTRSTSSSGERFWAVNDVRVQAGKQDVEAWSTLLVERHSPFCPWRIPDVVCADPVQQTDNEVLADVDRRENGLLAGLLHCPVMRDDGEKNSSVLSEFELLARAGWELGPRTANGDATLQCSYCLRLVVIQSFRHKAVARDSVGSKRTYTEAGLDADTAEPPTKVRLDGSELAPTSTYGTRRTPRPDIFEPYAAHRFYCPMYSRPDDADLSRAGYRVARVCAARRSTVTPDAAPTGDAAPSGGCEHNHEEAIAKAHDLLRELDKILA
jgi:hypothetical protein